MTEFDSLNRTLRLLDELGKCHGEDCEVTVRGDVNWQAETKYLKASDACYCTYEYKPAERMCQFPVTIIIYAGHVGIFRYSSRS